MEVEVERRIEAPVEVVFGVATELDWMKGLHEVWWPSGSVGGVGNEFIAADLEGNTYRYVLTKWEPPHALAFSDEAATHMGLLSLEHTDGGCLARWRTESKARATDHWIERLFFTLASLIRPLARKGASDDASHELGALAFRSLRASDDPPEGRSSSSEERDIGLSTSEQPQEQGGTGFPPESVQDEGWNEEATDDQTGAVLDELLAVAGTYGDGKVRAVEFVLAALARGVVPQLISAENLDESAVEEVMSTAGPLDSRSWEETLSRARERFATVDPSPFECVVAATTRSDPALEKALWILGTSRQEVAALASSHTKLRRVVTGRTVMLNTASVLVSLAEAGLLIQSAASSGWWKVALIPLTFSGYPGTGPLVGLIAATLLGAIAAWVVGAVHLLAVTVDFLLNASERREFTVSAGTEMSLREVRSVHRWLSPRTARLQRFLQFERYAWRAPELTRRSSSGDPSVNP